MYQSIADFIAVWHYESACTEKYLAALAPESLTAIPHERVRSAGYLAWHMIYTVHEMMSKTGLTVAGKNQQDYNGETVSELAAAWRISSESLVAELNAKWTDPDLATEDNMYGMQWRRGHTLEVLLHHNAHHRGQLSVVMRMNGIIVPGIYGPAYEEWDAMGLPRSK